MTLFLRQTLIYPGDLIVDIGCGVGSMALELERALPPDCRYLGFDVHGPSIEWCRSRFAKDPRFRFEHAEISTPYSSSRGPSATEFRFPVADGSAGLVFAKSVFTHLLEPEVRQYLAEIRRVLAVNRTAAISTFLFRRGSEVPAFPTSGPGEHVRYRSRSHPHAAVAYDREFFERLAIDAGFRVDYIETGFWPGEDTRPRGQDFVFLVPRS
jgi:SAM-dependent methyltransferase